MVYKQNQFICLPFLSFKLCEIKVLKICKYLLTFKNCSEIRSFVLFIKQTETLYDFNCTTLSSVFSLIFSQTLCFTELCTTSIVLTTTATVTVTRAAIRKVVVGTVWTVSKKRKTNSQTTYLFVLLFELKFKIVLKLQ